LESRRSFLCTFNRFLEKLIGNVQHELSVKDRLVAAVAREVIVIDTNHVAHVVTSSGSESNVSISS
jgi:hypothetical protein